MYSPISRKSLWFCLFYLLKTMHYIIHWHAGNYLQLHINSNRRHAHLSNHKQVLNSCSTLNVTLYMKLYSKHTLYPCRLNCTLSQNLSRQSRPSNFPPIFNCQLNFSSHNQKSVVATGKGKILASQDFDHGCSFSAK